ncbi:MAG TPA: DNA polymerase Y family protein, partial [Acetobacteraceae bacterium]
MRRVISVWLPTWPTDRLRKRADAPPADAPLVTAGHDGRRQAVMAADAAARALGVSPGMPLMQARALVANLVVMPAEPEADAAGLRRLAGWCLRYAPLVAADGPDGIWADVTGCAHLWDAEAHVPSPPCGRGKGEGANIPSPPC